MSSERSKKNARDRTSPVQKIQRVRWERTGMGPIVASIHYESRAPPAGRGGKINESSSSLAVERPRANKCNTRCSICIHLRDDARNRTFACTWRKVSSRRRAAEAANQPAIGSRSRLTRDVRRDVRTHVEQPYLSRSVIEKHKAPDRTRAMNGGIRFRAGVPSRRIKEFKAELNGMEPYVFQRGARCPVVHAN